jgi:formylglycine-generating enzyme required for sulfatase activity
MSVWLHSVTGGTASLPQQELTHFQSPAKPKSAIDAGDIPTPIQVASPLQGPPVPNPLISALRKLRNIPWLWFYVAALPLLALLGIIIHNVTDNGTIKISGRDTNMVVRIDGRKISIESLDDPITLRTGFHEMEVTRGDLIVKTQTFEIHRGQETPLDVADIPKPPVSERVAKKEAEFSSPRTAASSKNGAATADVDSSKPAPPSRKPQPASPQPKREWTNSIGMKFVRIQPGEFLMGTTKDQVDQLMQQFPSSERKWFNNEQPAHSIRLSKAFYLGIHEVTQDQYRAVTRENPSIFKGSDDLPVENVSWLDAVKFCNKLSERERRMPCFRINGSEVTPVAGNGYRLPTEAEWEYAARAKSTTIYPFGDDPSKLGEHAWFFGNSESKTHQVGQKQPNRWGLYDMLGNVWEWCADGYDENYYASSPSIDPRCAATDPPRVLRGGGWDYDPRGCRPANRNRDLPVYRDNNLGFRAVAVQE